MVDYNKPIPEGIVPVTKIYVGNPSDEKLVYLDDEFECDSMYYHWVEKGGEPLPGTSPSIMARETVMKLLHQAEDLLPEGYHFKIYDAYRPIAVQQALYDYFKEIKRKENPDVSEEELEYITICCCSFPSYNVLIPSVHNTGGAVDLTIVDENGEELDMGCLFDEFTDLAWTNSFEPDSGKDVDNEKVRANRRLLYNVMTEVGFVNFPPEWWHFDYGDGMWAQLKRENPLYAGILDAEVRNSLPYRNMDKVREANEIEQKRVETLREIYNSNISTDASVGALMRK